MLMKLEPCHRLLIERPHRLMTRRNVVQSSLYE